MAALSSRTQPPSPQRNPLAVPFSQIHWYIRASTPVCRYSLRAPSSRMRTREILRACQRIMGRPYTRPEGLCFSATLKSGRATAKPIVSPRSSANAMSSGTTMGLSCLAVVDLLVGERDRAPVLLPRGVVEPLDRLHFL